MDTSSSSVAPIASFDGTLGALYISMVVGAVVYGTVCLQFFIYLTAKRTKEDGWWLRSFAMFLFVRIFSIQVLMFASMYKFLITGYQNLLVLVDSGTGSAQVLNSRDYIQDKLGAEATVQQNSASQMERVTVSINDFIESKPVFAPFQGSGYNPSPIPETFETFELKQSKISADFETREPRKRWSSWDSKNLSRGGD
ncbi:hypothetical protein K435DRAFT_858063 [Dendrothele bispora CBS 962.96]|uniref:Uncharacterized protein n=1 Tax=Dendrothele bispora (strain CBS 962.96) TaxID=1314807 RepID=A0A4V6T5G0_DENBC|nr:hypothetical protein K435DRAFT_858063 [Dendrothele bispora CBS 962.96]